jgi:hypothetical protein
MPGAVGDGITDDTAAINRTIAAGTIVYFPPGTYKYVGAMTLSANKSYRIYGDGPGVSTILFFGGPNAGITVSHTQMATLNVEGLTLMANSQCTSCGTAINAVFGPVAPNPKFHTATIHNVQIIGSARDGTSGGYWTSGIHLYRGQNSVMDKIEISGNKNVTQSGIFLDAATSGENATGFQLSDIAVKWCNVGLATNGWVEGLYMTGFNFYSCGRAGLPSISLNGTTVAGTTAGAFQLVNGLVDSYGGGVTMSNHIYGKVSNVTFKHNDPEVSHCTMLSVDNVKPMVVSDCSFYGTSTDGPYENGVFLNNTTGAQVTGNNFANMQSLNAGSGIVVYYGTSMARITDNLFSSTVRSRIDNRVPDTYYCGNYPTNNCGSTP